MVCGMKLKTITRYIIALTLSLCLITAGCKKNNNTINIKYSTWGSETEINILKPIIKEFEKNNPNIKVDIMHIPQNYFQKLHMLVAANLAPDVMFINNLNMPVYASGNILSDLNYSLSNSSKISHEDFFPQSLKTMSYNRNLMAIPRDISNIVIYYNKDLFDKYNVEYPQEDWTFEEFLEKAQQLTIDINNDKKIDIFGISFETNAIFFLPFVWSQGGNLFDKKNQHFALAEKNSCTALQFYADLRNNYQVAPTAAEAGNSTMAQMFMQQKLAMFISGRWSVPRFRTDLDFEWDIASFPSGKAGSVVGIDGSGWSMYSRTKHPKESWMLIEYLASNKSIAEFSKTGLIVPSRKDVAFSENFINKGLAPEHAEIFLTIIDNGKPTPKTERWNEVVDLINIAMEPVWNGKQKSCPALQSIKSSVNELLE